MKKIQRVLLSGMVVAAAFVSSPSSPVRAATVACRNGSTEVAGGYTVAINGVTTAAVEPGRYDKYWVLVCRNTQNRDYDVYAGQYDPNTDGGQGRFTAADLSTEFTISFLPEAGTTPMVAQGHGVMSSFTIDEADSNRVTIVTKPILYSDIYGNDCGNVGPAECVLAVKNTNGDKASADNIEIRLSVRYSETGKPAEGDFAVLKGMRWSSSAYYFWMRTMCPTNGATNNAVSIEVGGPHYKADGSTLNYGDITVFIPTASVIACFGAPPSIVQGSLAVTRTVNGSTASATTDTTAEAGLQYTVTADDATGLTITIPRVTFSKPTYAVSTKSGKSLAKKTRTYTALLQLAMMKKPAGGSVKVVTRTSKVCTGVVAKMYAYRKGTCRASVVTFNKKGKKVASRTVSFKVGA